ncbi:MAG TPA: hypothetical protein VG820_13370 [Fimbriimonadaceae bacterium]|nr:hypothetical protein [Fimbriimonadaceae bacterium]
MLITGLAMVFVGCILLGLMQFQVIGAPDKSGFLSDQAEGSLFLGVAGSLLLGVSGLVLTLVALIFGRKSPQ